MLKVTNPIIRSFVLVILLSILSGCATTTRLSRNDVLQRYDEIVALQTHLQQAETNGIDYLAPTGYSKSQSLLDQAIEAGQAQRGGANTLATEGFKRLAKAGKDAETSRNVMREVLTARKRARQAKAPYFQASQYIQLEHTLKRATAYIERGHIEKAKKARPELISGYSRLELAALKQDTVQAARDSILFAKRNNADDYAPKTFQLAEDELELAIEVLNADRRQIEKANKHALKAKQLANRSMHIADLVKSFKRRNYSKEDMVLWYQQQLTIANEPYADELFFDRSNHEEISQLREKGMNNLAALETTQQHWADTKASQNFDRAAEARFDQIRDTFSEWEAEVSRKGENVLLMTHAFHFPVGGAEIHAENFELLRKIMATIKMFDNPRVVVSGHTDATGSQDKNEALSYMRADNVVTFLREISSIPANRLVARGFGEEHPIASNDTQEGRMRNRRIEVLIVNE